jgi:hypothetical protein
MCFTASGSELALADIRVPAPELGTWAAHALAAQEEAAMSHEAKQLK